MAVKLDVPEELKPAYHQIMQLAPQELLDDESFQCSVLMYLKVGGPRLARQHVKITAMPFCEEFSLLRRLHDEDDGEDDEQDDGNDEEADAAEEENGPDADDIDDIDIDDDETDETDMDDD